MRNIPKMLISSTLIGAMISGGTAYASTDIKPLPISSIDYGIEGTDELALISNLKMATKVLETAISSGEFHIFTYEKIMKSLSTLDAKVLVDREFKAMDLLVPALDSTDALLQIRVEASDAILAKRADSINALASLRKHLGISKGEVSILSYKEVKIIIDGVRQHYNQTAVVKDGSTLVPLRGIFESLGAKVDWFEESQTVIATKGDTTIELSVNNRKAFVNDKLVNLSVEAQKINGTTMVPLRFISEALGAKATWDATTFTATITSGGTATPVKEQATSGKVVHGIKVLYGDHTYNTNNQAEYDAVMKVVQEALVGVENLKLANNNDTTGYDYDYDPLYYAYINGDRAENYPRFSFESIGLTAARNTIGGLVEAGVSTPDILKVVQAATVAWTLVHQVKDVGADSRSAYDALVKKESAADCDAISYVYSAVLDAMGYNTLVLASETHADPYVQVDGKWYSALTVSFRAADIQAALGRGSMIDSQPTFGPRFVR